MNSETTNIIAYGMGVGVLLVILVWVLVAYTRLRASSLELNNDYSFVVQKWAKYVLVEMKNELEEAARISSTPYCGEVFKKATDVKNVLIMVSEYYLATHTSYVGIKPELTRLLELQDKVLVQGMQSVLKAEASENFKANSHTTNFRDFYFEFLSDNRFGRMRVDIAKNW